VDRGAGRDGRATAGARIRDRVNRDWRAQGRPDSEVAARATVVDCFRPGRRRLNADLVVAIVRALHDEPGYVDR
jgi:hypothetical protein